MDAAVHYGKGLVSLRIPEANVEEIIRPWQDEGKADNATLVRQAMTGKGAVRFQGEAAGKCLCVLIDDGTREEPFEDIFRQLFGVLCSGSRVRFLICTGTHDAETTENQRIKEQIEQAAREAGVGAFDIHTNDCERDRFVAAGRTSQGT
jgi:nickel-dependent lactate racemase